MATKYFLVNCFVQIVIFTQAKFSVREEYLKAQKDNLGITDDTKLENEFQSVSANYVADVETKKNKHDSFNDDKKNSK